jgi:SAM-dependent methyltransferase
MMDNLEEYYGLPRAWFERMDDASDESFYAQPRLVAHIDQATLEALTQFYTTFIPPHSDVLDLMSSWISHLPMDLELGRVVGLGMNAQELGINEQLDEWAVQNLNKQPELPYATNSFDRVLIVVSIQYLREPIDVLASALDVLREGGEIAIAMSHRLFPTKAIAAFQSLSTEDRMGLVQYYLQQAGFREVEFVDRSPPDADPLWIMTGKK